MGETGTGRTRVELETSVVEAIYRGEGRQMWQVRGRNETE